MGLATLDTGQQARYVQDLAQLARKHCPLHFERRREHQCREKRVCVGRPGGPREFAGVAGADEGGLATEMPRLFFEGLVDPRLGLFESSSSVADGADGGADGSGDGGGAVGGVVYLPKSGELGGRGQAAARGRGAGDGEVLLRGQARGLPLRPQLFQVRTRQREHRAVRALLPSSLFSRVLCGALLLPRAADRPRPHCSRAASDGAPPGTWRTARRSGTRSAWSPGPWTT